MSKPSFVYVTYIRSTPEKVWQALTAPEFTKQVWFGAVHQTEWKPGAAWKLLLGDGRIADAGKIVEYDPPRRLVIGNWQNQFMPEVKEAGPSRCTIDIEPVGEAVKLTITHVSETDNRKLIDAVSGGWPKILSNLKSLLETGALALETK
ncbi:MAG: SRPBCC family protein [Pseudolabrys sp.]